MEEAKMKSLKVVVSVLAIALLIVSTIAYFLNLPFYGYILDVAVPLCIIAVYLSLKPKKNAKITPILMLMLTMFSFGLETRKKEEKRCGKTNS
jgi:flagellar biosynthesis component FlhA